MGARGFQPQHLGITPPLCLGNCGTPVKRHYGVRLDRAPRVVDGIAWRRYCIKCCAAHAAHLAAPVRNHGAAEWRRRKTRQRIERARDTLRVFADANDRIPLIEAVRYVMQEERVTYARGYSAAHARLRRANQLDIRERKAG